MLPPIPERESERLGNLIVRNHGAHAHVKDSEVVFPHIELCTEPGCWALSIPSAEPYARIALNGEEHDHRRETIGQYVGTQHGMELRWISVWVEEA